MENERKEASGFSKVINAKEYSRTSKYVVLAVCAIIAVIAVGFYFYNNGGISGDNIYQIAVVGAVILASAAVGFYRISGHGNNKSWVGEITEKRIEQEGDINRYYLDVVKEDGSKDSLMCSDRMFAYYSVGDKIKRHAGYDYWEKYDKSGDQDIICIRCGRFTDIDKDRCDNCKSPLLK